MNTTTQKFECEECGKSANTAWGLRVHWTRAHKDKELPPNLKNLPPRKFKKKNLNLQINNQVIDTTRAEVIINKERVLPEFFNCCPQCGHNFAQHIPVFNVAARMKE
jgi:hypothetical protein